MCCDIVATSALNARPLGLMCLRATSPSEAQEIVLGSWTGQPVHHGWPGVGVRGGSWYGVRVGRGVGAEHNDPRWAPRGQIWASIPATGADGCEEAAIEDFGRSARSVRDPLEPLRRKSRCSWR